MLASEKESSETSAMKAGSLTPQNAKAEAAAASCRIHD
jgi:hypothetical protein